MITRLTKIRMTKTETITTPKSAEITRITTIVLTLRTMLSGKED